MISPDLLPSFWIDPSKTLPKWPSIFADVMRRREGDEQHYSKRDSQEMDDTYS